MERYVCNFSTCNEIFRFHKRVCEALCSDCPGLPPLGHSETLIGFQGELMTSHFDDIT